MVFVHGECPQKIIRIRVTCSEISLAVGKSEEDEDGQEVTMRHTIFTLAKIFFSILPGGRTSDKSNS